jgi:uncharacterized protein YmfQ (DUF2313 family)
MARQAIFPRFPWGGIFINETGIRASVLPRLYLNETAVLPAVVSTPASGAIVIQGFAATAALTSAPAAGAIVVDGFAPRSDLTSAPATAAVTFTGFSPFSGLAVKAASSPAPASLGDVDFQQAMLRLLPRGRVWRRDPGSTLSALMLALAPTYARGMQAAAQVLIDASPATTENLLVEWEESLGLPDTCTASNPSIEQRQAAVRAKWGARGSLTIAYFVALAANLGFTITITEFTPFTVDRPCDEALCEPEWSYVWQVNAPQVVTFYFAVDESGVDDPLEVYDAGELVCRIRADAPAETIVFFTFS